MENKALLGEIYVARCKTTSMAYVGKAKKYMGEHMIKWGHKCRWTRHILESQKEGKKEYNLEISIAIRKYGKDDFELEHICDCRLEDMDNLEQFFVKDLDTLHPKGYNMTEGGTDGKHCEASIEKRRVKRTPMSDETRQEMARKRQEPKAEQTDVPKEPKERTLPEHIYPIMEEGVLTGYYVSGLTTFDDDEIPRRNFNMFTNMINYEHALKFIKLVEDCNERQEVVDDWLEVELPKNIKSDDLPNHIRPMVYKGALSGYRVDYFVGYEGKKQIVDSKCYTSKKLSMTEKLELAKKYVAEMEIKYNTEETEDIEDSS